MVILEPTPTGCRWRPRRLTPLECARLLGFPDHWTRDLAITHPTDEELDYWLRVWRAWSQARGVAPKTRRQVAAWLANPASNTGMYKLWGNGVALLVAEHVLARVKQYAHMTG